MPQIYSLKVHGMNYYHGLSEMKFSLRELRMSGETDVSATKIYNRWSDKVARTRANVALGFQLPKNTRSFSFRVVRELDLSGIIKRIEEKRKRKKKAYLFTKRRDISLAGEESKTLPARG